MPSLHDVLHDSARAGRGQALACLGASSTGEGFGTDGPVAAFLAGTASAAPYLGRLLRRADVPRLLSVPAEESWSAILTSVRRLAGTAEEVGLRLREAKREAHLILALADLSGHWTMLDVTARLSSFADACVEVALRASWEGAAAHRRADLALPASGPVPGIAVIAMGKLGACELNYSSDIDLVVAFDPDRMPLGPDDRLGPRAVATAVVKGLLAVLSDQTPAGYVFRTDLRLRPDPSSTAPAVSLGAAERYYEQYGQTWERAAYVKARACAGDPAVGAAYLDIVRPFVWRRTLDFAAIADIRAIKRQIHAQVGSPEIVAAGGDVKLGPGGIREVEFFAQTQQLILGGRDDGLRVSGTLAALSALADRGHVASETATALGEAYVLLRDVEHRIQMTQDAADQTLPGGEEGRGRIAVLMGAPSLDAFDEEVLVALRTIHDAYAELFGPPPAGEAHGSLVFTGVDDDPRTLATLRGLGFVEPERAARAIRAWHQGELPAARSLRAREVLTGLVPRLLAASGATGEADEAFAAVDGFLRLLPSGLQLFSLLTAHPGVLDDVVTLCAASPAIARSLGRRPRLVEELLDGAEASLLRLPPGGDLEAVMDAVRRHASGEKLRAAAALTLGRGDPYETGRRLAALADQCVATLSNAAAEAMGEAAGPPLCVLAFGRHGAGGLTVASDLDLVFVYESGADAVAPALKRVRRLVAALSAPTAEGVLYEVDMKLRPSGGQGPAAVSLTAFERYYEDDARMWEAMALTKARVVHAEGDLGERVDRIVRDRITTPREASRVTGAASEMRARLLGGHPARGPLDVKRMAGGLTDIDFVAQVLTLTAGGAERPPRATPDALRWHADRGRLGSDDTDALIGAHRLFESVIQHGRATFGQSQPRAIKPVREARLARLVGLEPGTVAAGVETASRRTTEAFERLVGPYD